MAKINYRGHEITVTRDKCMAGYDLLYVSIFRLSDGFECTTFPYDGAETVSEMLAQMKNRVDNELSENDPWCEKEYLSVASQESDKKTD